MKKVLLIFSLLMSFFSYSLQTNEEKFNSGIKFYNEGEYEKAISSFSSILETGQHSKSLYFNLGNSYYKINDIANSIFHYEKALLLSPNDKDVLNNLGFTKKALIDKIEILPTNQVKQFWIYILNFFNVNQWLYIGIFLLYMSAMFFLFYYFNVKSSLKKKYFFTSLVSLFLSLSFIYNGISLNNNKQSNLFAIIFDEKIDFRSEPNYRSEILFNLHEGTKVQVKEELSDWSLVEILDGNKGWIESSSIKKIN